MRLAAPEGDGAILAVPAFQALPPLIEANRQRLNHRFSTLRQSIRNEWNLAGPVIVAGHQPELFHPGVWVKNFATFGIARKCRGTPVFLIADTDTIRSSAIPIPGSTLRFDSHTAEEPYETRQILDETAFASFPARLAEAAVDWPFRPIGLGLKVPDSGTLAERFSIMRRSFEHRWGCENREWLVSQMCHTMAFREFASDLIANRDRLRDCYNRAILSYRARHKLRSQNHPAPLLEAGELPFWSIAGRRRLRTFDVSSTVGLRPKALILTLFARLILGDLFIHGLGGGKYDEATDDIIRDFFDIEPPAYQILTATLRLPFSADSNPTASLPAMRQQLRQACWVPQRLTGDWSEHESIRRLPTLTHPQRLERFRRFRELRRRELPNVAAKLSSLEESLKRREAEAQNLAQLRRRDYAWVIHPEETLRPLMQHVLEAV